VFFKRIERGEFFLGWGLTQGFSSWVGWEGEVCLLLKLGRWDYLNFSRICFFGGVGWLGKGGGYILFFFFFFLLWQFFHGNNFFNESNFSMKVVFQCK
jgi:hypothetical protein